ncbi:MAG: ribonuclease P protein subunit [Archaeoglobaceae archaeon]
MSKMSNKNKGKPEHVVAHEWIGREVLVGSSPNRFEEGLNGEVVDETLNTFTLKTEKSLKTVAKRNRIFHIEFMGKNMRVYGNYLCFRPEDRIKRGIMLLSKMKR